MSSFFELVRFEYKKIFKKRSTIIVLILGIFLTGINRVGTLLGNHYVNGEVFESKYEAMKKDRDNIRKLSGREINSDLLKEAIEAYSRIPYTEGPYVNTDEYQKYARPYSEIYSIIRRVYNIDSLKQLASITEENLNDFYTIRQSIIEKTIDNTMMNAKEKAFSINLSRKVKTPFIYSYTGGYVNFIAQMTTTSFIICFICSICISPLFAGEYTNGMDSLVFSSKYGRNKMIGAKIFTGISFTVLLSMVLIAVSYIIIMLLFGWDGSDAPIQLYLPLTIVPYTMGQVALLYSLLILFANVLSSSITMVLSAKIKSPFIVLAIMTAISIIPGFINVSEDVLWLYHLFHLIPVNMFNFGNIISIYSIDFLGLTIRPYVLMISFAAVVSIALLPIAFRSYKNNN